MKAALRPIAATALATVALGIVPAHASAPRDAHSMQPVRVDVLVGRLIASPPVAPFACQSYTTPEYYPALVVNGITYHVEVDWTRNFDCSHWASLVDVTASGGHVINLSGATVNGVLGYYVSGGMVTRLANTIYNQCKPTDTGYKNYFSGSNVPSNYQAVVDLGLATVSGSCSNALNAAYSDDVN